jgi:hypothetical protein
MTTMWLFAGLWVVSACPRTPHVPRRQQCLQVEEQLARVVGQEAQSKRHHIETSWGGSSSPLVLECVRDDVLWAVPQAVGDGRPDKLILAEVQPELRHQLVVTTDDSWVGLDVEQALLAVVDLSESLRAVYMIQECGADTGVLNQIPTCRGHAYRIGRDSDGALVVTRDDEPFVELEPPK